MCSNNISQNVFHFKLKQSLFMKKYHHAIQNLLIASCLLLSACSKKKEVSGSVFIVTKGSENIKLGLVDVVAFNRFKFKEKYIDNRKAGLTNDVLWPITEHGLTIIVSEAGLQLGRDKLKEIFEQNPDMSLSQMRTYQNIIEKGEGKNKKLYEKYFELQQQLIPLLIETSKSKQISKTDADGRFRLQDIGSDDTIVALGNRMAGGSHEVYAWVIKYEDIPESGQIMLSNNNLVNDGGNGCDLSTGIRKLYPSTDNKKGK